MCYIKEIRDLRKDRDITQKNGRNSFRQSKSGNYERRELYIPTEILVKLAYFHKVSVDYILK